MDDKLYFDIEADELEIFLEEVNDHLNNLETGILEIEQQTGSPDTIHSVFRAAHTLKALAGTVGHKRMAGLTHTMETLFDAMREDNLTVTDTIVDDLLETIDVLKALRDEIVTGEASNVAVEVLADRLRTILQGEPEDSSPGGQAATTVNTLTPDHKAQVLDYQQKGFNIYQAKVSVDVAGFAPAARLSQAAMALMEAGEIIYQNPTMQDLVNGKYDGNMFCVVASKQQLEQVKTLLSNVSDLAAYEADTWPPQQQPATEKKPAPQKAPPTKQAKPKPTSTASVNADLSAEKTVRISVDRLDSLMNLVGELVTGRNRLLQIEGALLAQHGKDGVGELGEMSGQLGRVVDQLQEEVMRARMLPIAHVFNKIPRLVRDLSRSVGKKVNLIIEGEETELDRSLIEYLGDPLIHLLRNAMDHGVESPAERTAKGKPAEGVVRLAATHEEGHIVITIEDDGNGIDPERVRRSAVNKGMITQEEAAQMDSDQSVDLIFRPNLSTAETVTAVSGRGVGMDVVRANIERLSGSVTVDSTLGVGTTFRITLPLTLAIVQSMLVTVKQNVYAIPLAGIIESLYLADVKIRTIKGSPTILWRDSVLPLLDLREFFDDIRLGSQNGQGKHASNTAVITVAWGKQRTGLIVDGIIGNQDIVVKSLSTVMGELPGLSGGAILGDGRIALIVDVPGLIGTSLQLRRG